MDRAIRYVIFVRCSWPLLSNLRYPYPPKIGTGCRGVGGYPLETSMYGPIFLFHRKTRGMQLGTPPSRR